ncbi:putative transmembrane protein [Senna tora]|uniref:Putative transmembrane protein n=1 Tax=Senna tora TaxID=362788 RepID=A0A834X6T8_9FABA|nr:putative transmembrane protein [Senna tora]
MNTSLQAWKLLRTKDLAVQEIMEERRAAIESGRLKGRRLFEPMEGNTNENHYKNGFSGDMGDQETDVRSLSFDYSEDEESSSSSLPCMVAIALLIFAMYMSWTRNFEGHEGILVPT